MTTRRKTLGSAFAASLLVTLPACADGSDAVAVPGAEAAATIALDELTTATVATTTPVAAPSTTATTVADTTTTTTTVATTTSTAPTTAATPTTEVEASTAPAEDPFLRPGDTGSRVSLLQIKLIALGYLAAGSDNGTFGPATASAVLAFQGDYGLIVDGIVGPETERALTAAAQSINPEQP